MANDADNLVLTQLREIRATLAGHSARFDRIDERFAEMDERFDQISERFDQIEKRLEDVHDLVDHGQGRPR